MKVTARVEFTELENEDGHPVDGVTVTCSKCGHCTEALGTGSASVRYAMLMLRKECPRRQRNFYTSVEASSQPRRATR